MRHFKHLTFTDRLRIEKMLKEKYPVRDIADKLRVSDSTIYREIQRGRYTHMNTDLTTNERYSPDIAEERYRAHLAAKGPTIKIGNDYTLANHIEQKIADEKYSPAAVLGEIKSHNLTFRTTISVRTLYSYIEKGIFLRLTVEQLPREGKHKQKYNRIRRLARPPKGESIEKRPKTINDRSEWGNWEMDCVEGKKKSKRTLLCLTERVSRKELLFLMPDQTTRSVVATLDRLERKIGKKAFRKIFKSVTVDNGSEFADCKGMERSAFDGSARTKIYYCHPYSSWERGSNENANLLVRRHFPKGFDFRKTTVSAVKVVEEWINNYPRGIFNYKTANHLFEQHLKSAGMSA